MKPFPVLAGLWFCVLLSATGQTTAEASPAVECPAGPLVGVQVLSAQRGEAIDESAPPDLIPDEQFTRGGTLHQVWKMNSDGPGWDFFVWCTYQGNPKAVKLPAPNVKHCERTLSMAHQDKPPQHMTCE